jgi:WD40 repeat protein
MSFSPVDPHTVYAYYKGLLTLYHSTKPLQLFRIPCDTANAIESNKIMWHPTKTEFLYPSGKQTISVIQPDNKYKIKDNIIFLKNNNISVAQYSHDATIIAIKDNYRKCCLYDLINNSFYHFTSSKYHSIVFHPKNSMIALLTHSGAIEYWNYKTKNIIAKTHNYHNNSSTRKLFSRTKRLDFSDDGKYLAIGLAHTWLVLHVPTNNLVVMYFLLKKHVPDDVIKIILHTLAHTLELESLNFLELLNI